MGGEEERVKRKGKQRDSVRQRDGKLESERLGAQKLLGLVSG